ncbi:type 4a pilus biogenesis protein PilO [Patescibacteria group bacterium]|nr:type 4a pilus biogenesis protein PilO [Patescibacteria group bacterium]MBU1613150.1 type 4a pilus biogenesis protein PilO [Patescibacteria group bacterium]
MATKANKNTLAAIILFASTTAIIVAVIIIPILSDIRSLNKETDKTLAYLEQRSQNVQNLRVSLQQAEKIQQEVAEYEKTIFKQGDELSLITLLEDIAQKNDIILKIENSNIDDKKIYKYLLVSFTINGAYRDILNYVNDLENQRYFININNINVAATADRTANASPGGAVANINISLYVNR